MKDKEEEEGGEYEREKRKRGDHHGTTVSCVDIFIYVLKSMRERKREEMMEAVRRTCVCVCVCVFMTRKEGRGEGRAEWRRLDIHGDDDADYMSVYGV